MDHPPERMGGGRGGEGRREISLSYMHECIVTLPITLHGALCSMDLFVLVDCARLMASYRLRSDRFTSMQKHKNRSPSSTQQRGAAEESLYLFCCLIRVSDRAFSFFSSVDLLRIAQFHYSSCRINPPHHQPPHQQRPPPHLPLQHRQQHPRVSPLVPPCRRPTI